MWRAAAGHQEWRETSKFILSHGRALLRAAHPTAGCVEESRHISVCDPSPLVNPCETRTSDRACKSTWKLVLSQAESSPDTLVVVLMEI